MKVTGIFYLSNGCVHREVIKFSKKKHKEAIKVINYMVDVFGRNKDEINEGRIQFGYFAANSQDIIAMRIK